MSDFGSPFATVETHTYKLAEPLPQWKLGDDGAVERDKAGQPIMVDVDFAAAFDVPEDVAAEYWIRMRLPTSRADNATIQEFGAPGAADWSRDVFLHLCEAWSIDPEVKGEDFDRLKAWVYKWIDACVIDAYSRGIAGRAEKKSSGSRPRRASRARPTAAA